ncbi:MAG: molybdenum cofactor guanylyltransferase [Syntrophales bacterium]|nr:molybdenum cofactor guanylyltransferase [Syntrophales bacterium]
MVTGIILAGGRSTRMGTNKALIRIGGERLIDRTVRVYREVFDDIILVTNEPLLYVDQDVAIVTDVVPGRGPLMGIFTGLLFAAHDAAFVAPCDMPYLTAGIIP